MTEDLLKGIAAAARAQDPASDPRLAARIDGTLSAEDAAELEALGEHSEAYRAAWIASEPISAEKRAQFVERLPRPKVVWLRPIVVAGALAAAAAFALIVHSTSPEPLPAYAMVVTGGELEDRSDDGKPAQTEVIRLGPGSSLELTLRPAVRASGEVAVQGYLIRNGQARRWDVRAEISKEGAIRIQGDRESLFGGEPAGEVEIAVAVGRPGEMPPNEEAALRGGGDAQWMLFRRRLELTEEKVPKRRGDSP
jgi:hypothetical protein